MALAKEEPASTTEPVIDLKSAVKNLHGRSSQDLHRLLRETEDFCIHYRTENGSSKKIDVEKLAAFLPLHLIALLISSNRDEELFRYLICGIRLLNSLCELAPRHAKLEQILIDDVKISEQMLDLVFYLLIVLGGFRQANHNSDGMSLMHAPLVASSLYLLHSCISSLCQDLVQVLLAHPKVDFFIDAAFGAVHNVIRSLQMTLLSRESDNGAKLSIYAERRANFLCHQAEASMQFLYSLCQQKPFRERLVRNKELCGNGGVLMLARSILLSAIPPRFSESSKLVASISRMKAKVLSILLHLFEAESVSFLDEVASAGNLDLAKCIAEEVLGLLKTTLSKNSKNLRGPSDRTDPMGFLQLNAMRLIDIFTDDSNFRSYFTLHLSEVLGAMLSLSHGDFLSMWCSSEHPPREEDATLEYDIFASAGWVLDLFSSSEQANVAKLEVNLLPNNLPQSSYVHQRTSLFVKMIANLHCFIPNVCEEQERNRFLHNVMASLQKDPPKVLPGFYYTSCANRAASVCKNFRSLLSHAESLIPKFLNEEDLQLMRVFFDQLQPQVHSEFEESEVLEAQSTGGCPSPKQRNEPQNLNNGSGNLREETSETSAFRAEDLIHSGSNNMDMGDGIIRKVVEEEKDTDVPNNETSGSDTSSTRGKTSVDRFDNGELPKSNKHSKESGSGEVKEEEKVETVQSVEKQRRKRKRSIMNDEQIAMIERVLVDEPEMQRNAALVQTWADKLSHHGSEVTSSQLRNWLNNRKAKLARESKQAGPARDNIAKLPDSPSEENNHSQKPLTAKAGSQSSHTSRNTTGENSKSSVESVKCMVGQHVVLTDGKGVEVGKGKVHQVEGKWYGMWLDESRACVVVDVVELKSDKRRNVLYPTETTGVTFEEAESKIGVMRVMWDSSKLLRMQEQ